MRYEPRSARSFRNDVGGNVDAILDSQREIESHDILTVDIAQEYWKVASCLGSNPIKMDSDRCAFGNDQIPVNHLWWPPILCE
jgi:hypothetical protein